MRKMPNLNEEIAAMALASSSSASSDFSRNDDSTHKYSQNLNAKETVPKMRRSRSRLVQEIRISVSFPYRLTADEVMSNRNNVQFVFRFTAAIR